MLVEGQRQSSEEDPRMRHIGLLAAAVAVVSLLPATVGAQEGFGGRVFEIDPIPGSPPPGLFTGTGDFNGTVTNPAYTVSEYLGSARALFADIPVWSAAYVESTNTMFFTTSISDPGDEDGSQMFAWTGGLPVPFCT